MSYPVFSGTPEQQALADEVFRIMRAQGRFFAPESSIKQTLNNLSDFLSQKYQRDRHSLATEIEAALQENAQVFGREEVENEVIYVTSRVGSSYPSPRDVRHTFKHRIYEPEHPLPIDDLSVVVSTSRPVLTSVEPVLISDYWQEQAEHATPPAVALPVEHEEEHVAVPAPPAEPTAQEPHIEEKILKEEEPIIPPASEQVEAEGAILRTGRGGGTLVGDEPAEAPPSEAVHAPQRSLVLPAEEVPIEAEDVPAEDAIFPFPDDAEVTLEAEEDLHVEEEEEVFSPGAGALPPDVVTGVPTEDTLPPVATEEVEAEAEVLEVEDVPPQPEEVLIATETAPRGTGADVGVITPRPGLPEVDLVLTLPDGTPINLGQPIPTLMAQHGDALEASLVEQLDKDPLRRIVHFGRWLYPEAGVVSLGKNDLRRIRDYIVEVGEPLPDTSIIADLYYHNPRNSDYEGFRFSLNYRLSREKDFEFVGVEGAYLWATRNLSVGGTRRVKAGEMGQITAYLTEPAYDESLQYQNAELVEQQGRVNRMLTFFEWQYGILPLDASLMALLPGILLPDQRSAVLRIESPQHYTNFLVEVRYPTGNRGGWVQGFDDFFHEHLIAGGMIELARTEEPNVFALTYEEITPETSRVLTMDEKKNKHTFSDVTYYCAVDEDQLLVQSRFGRAKNLKSLPMSERRKADVVLEHVFKVMGEQLGSRDEPVYALDLEELYTAYTVLRPVSRPYLRSLMEDHDDFSVDETAPDTYYYKPEPEPVEEAEEEEEIEDDLAARWGYTYDDM
jgi:hypothetical protein